MSRNSAVSLLRQLTSSYVLSGNHSPPSLMLLEAWVAFARHRLGWYHSVLVDNCIKHCKWAQCCRDPSRGWWWGCWYFRNSGTLPGKPGQTRQVIRPPYGIYLPFLSGRCLRILATHHIFHEVRPNVFANNRVSSLLDSGIPHRKIQRECVFTDSLFWHPIYHSYDSQLKKFTTYTSSCEISGYVGHLWVSSSSHLILSPEPSVPTTWGGQPFTTSTTVEPIHLLLRAPHFKGPTALMTIFFPGCLIPLINMNLLVIMLASGLQSNGTLLKVSCRVCRTPLHSWWCTHLSGFDWASIPRGSVIVDVGGGTGRPTMTLARAFSHLKIVIQDRESVIQEGIEVWKTVHFRSVWLIWSPSTGRRTTMRLWRRVGWYSPVCWPC